MTAFKPIYKKTLLGAVALVIIGILVLGGWLLWPKPVQEDQKKSAVATVAVDDVFATAKGFSDKGDTQGGLAYYDEQIDDHKNSNEKQQLLLYKSEFALDANEYQQAINAAKEADSISSTANTTSTLARAYEAKGDKQNAITYYKKAIELTPKNSMAVRYAGLWHEKIEELSE